MAPKKIHKPNAFIMFTLEWKKKYGKRLSFAEATTEAGKIWTTMNSEQRKPYQDMARGHSDETRLSCHGVPLSQIDIQKKEIELKERLIKRNIEQTVRQSVKRAELEHQKYYFIMINHFAKTLNNGSYIPAELGLCEFSLKLGVTRLYHTLINPNVRIYGFQYDAQNFSESTHNLPLPPNALGESNLSSIYNSVISFLNKSNGENCTDVNQKYPPIYTIRDSIPIVESCLEFLQADIGACNFKLDVYPIQYLFYIMKLATCEQGEIKYMPSNSYISDVQFERDLFEYQTGIACDFHEQIDKVKYCAQSIVTRWGYMFADYMCQDIAIQMIPGRHVPENTRLDAIITPAPPITYNDVASRISTHTTKALADDNKFSNDDDDDDDDDSNDNDNDNKKEVVFQGKEENDDEEFPSLASSSKHKQHNRKIRQTSLKAPQRHGSASGYTGANADDARYDDASSRATCRLHNTPTVHTEFNYDEQSEPNKEIDINSYGEKLNPWSARSKQRPREPSASDYSVQSTLNNIPSTISFGRGRLFLKK